MTFHDESTLRDGARVKVTPLGDRAIVVSFTVYLAVFLAVGFLPRG